MLSPLAYTDYINFTFQDGFCLPEFRIRCYKVYIQVYNTIIELNSDRKYNCTSCVYTKIIYCNNNYDN